LGAIGYEAGVHVELSRHSHAAVSIARTAFAKLRRLLCSEPDEQF
jgi:hypothetical protein